MGDNWRINHASHDKGKALCASPRELELAGQSLATDLAQAKRACPQYMGGSTGRPIKSQVASGTSRRDQVPACWLGGVMACHAVHCVGGQ